MVSVLYMQYILFFQGITIVMNIINLEGGSAEPPEPPPGYGPAYMPIFEETCMVVFFHQPASSFFMASP